MRTLAFGSLGGLLLALAGCSDSPTESTRSTGSRTSQPVLAIFNCTVDREARSPNCVPATPGASREGPSLGIIPGPNGTNVRLASSNSGYDSIARIYHLNVTVQNLMAQPLGTPDGLLVTGIRVFHSSGPTPTYYIPGDTGTVSVANPDGYGNFTASNQPYFEYLQILQTSQVSAAKTWNWSMPRTVRSFSFQVMVEATLPSETGLPPLPWNDYEFSDDTVAHPVTLPDSVVRYYRTAAGIVFDSTASAATFAAVLHKYGAVLVAGARGRGGHIVELPDAGPTNADVVARLDSIAAEPGVTRTYGLAYYRKTDLLMRFPDDAAALRRAGWRNGTGDSTDATWAMKAVRAPQAWGCETGTYTSSRVKIGVIDYIFDSTHPDLQGKTTVVSLTPPSRAVNRAQVLSMNPELLNHGTAVAGAITATGDNNTGVAGMVWGSELHLYPFTRKDGSDYREVRDKYHYFLNTVLPRAKAAGVKILVTSMRIHVPGENEVLQAEAALQGFVDTGAMVVMGAGNDMRTMNAADYVSFTGPDAVSQDIFLATAFRAILSGNRAGHFLAVGGTQMNSPGNLVRRTRSDFYPGGVEILAPAHRVAVLTHRDHHAVDNMAVENGTSIATPIVGGAAAQLWAFDPTLTAAQVKDYLIRGSQEPRRNPGTGAWDAVPAVPGFGGVRQLDAFSSLSLISRERSGVPVCGYPVQAIDDGILLDRSPGTQITLPVPGLYYGAPISIAPGGRKIAASRWTNAAEWVEVYSPQGALLQTFSGFQERYYLERDTVDVTLLTASGIPTFTIRRQDGTVHGPIDHFTSLYAGDAYPGWAHTYSFSPDGRYVSLGTVHHPHGNQPLRYKTYVAPLLGGPAVQAHDRVWNWWTETSAWTHDSRRVVFAYSSAPYPGASLSTQFTFADSSGAVITAPVTVPDVASVISSFTSDDAWLWTVEEPAGGGCREAARAAGSLITTVSQTVLPLTYCSYWYKGKANLLVGSAPGGDGSPPVERFDRSPPRFRRTPAGTRSR